MNSDLTFHCPVPHTDQETVTLAHGGGGTMMHRLLDGCFLKAFANPALEHQGDSAILNIGGLRLAFTTDTFVVRPLFFPGGDIGSLAVFGTVNDLAMQGARPLFLSAAFVLEEGLSMKTLHQVVASMRQAAHDTGVQIVTGDTKVIQRVQGDELLINTAGIGLVESPRRLGAHEICTGDAIIINGDLGRHGVAVMAAREGLAFEHTIESDAASLAGDALRLLEAGVPVHCMRDLTRGGLASALCELSEQSGLAFHLQERWVPVCDQVRGACELLGLDPLHVANEGRFVMFVPEPEVQRTIDLLQRHNPLCTPAWIGTVGDDRTAWVTIESVIGATRMLDMLSGEQLPRIC